MFDKSFPRILTVLLLLLASTLLFLTTSFRLMPSLLLVAALINIWRWFLATERPENEMTNKLISCCHYLGKEDKTD